MLGVDAVCRQAAMAGLGKGFAGAPDYRHGRTVGCNDLGTSVRPAGMAAAGVRRPVPAGSTVRIGDVSDP